MNIRQIRKKIKSVENVKKITKAMELVSAVKMKKSQQVAQEGRPFRSLLEKIIKRVISYLPDNKISPLLTPIEEAKEKKLIIFITSNKGLCGSFNFSLFKYLIKNYQYKNEIFITVGNKGAMFLTKLGGEILANFNQTPFINYTSAIFQTSLNQFLTGNVNQVVLIYNKFYNAFSIEPTSQILLPVKFDYFISGKEKIKGEDYLIEPSPKEIIDYLLRDYIQEMIRGAILESEAGEHSARMIAMKNATNNAKEVMLNLTLLKNKIRQEKITLELLDMITAKQSIEVISS